MARSHIHRKIQDWYVHILCHTCVIFVISVGDDEARSQKGTEKTSKKGWFGGFGSKTEDEDNYHDELVISAFF